VSWKHVLGHDVLVAAFASAAKRSRFGHAYLFIGPTGVGKYTFAQELAKTLLCEARGERFEACDECPSCHLVDAGTHPDLFIVARPEDKNELPIALIRGDDDEPGLLGNLALKPARGQRKVAILDDADDLSEEAANSFLKTLEEPPPRSLLILIGGATENRQKATILSRCQIIRFGSLPPAAMAKVLAAHGIVDTDKQRRLLQLAAGCPGQALALDDEEVWNFRGRLLKTLGSGKIDPVDVAEQWRTFIDNAGKDGAAQRARAAFIFRMVIVMLEAALKLSLGAVCPEWEENERQTLQELGDRAGEAKLLAWLERAQEADRQVEWYVQLVLVIEAFLDALSR
jgi:DNA polymerase-3 subunit delta'